MTRWRVGLWVVAAVAAASAAVPALAQAEEGRRQAGSIRYTTTEPGAATGTITSIDWMDPARPGGKPYSVKTFILRYPAGAAVDFDATEHCTASDAQLMTQGHDACPPGSRIGGGTIRSDTGSTGSFPPRFVDNVVNNYNGDGELVGVAETDNPPLKTVTHTTIEGTTFTTEFPAFPGNPPPDNYSAFANWRLHTDAIVRAGRVFGRTPPTCPASGNWVIAATFVYRDGVSQTVNTLSPCKRPGGGANAGAPKLRVRGVPRGHCASRALRLRVKVRGGAELKRTTVALDGRRIHTARLRSFRLHVRVAHLRPGRHRLVVRTIDAQLHRVKRARRFNRCG